jgi:hypothetical protein
MYRHLCSHLAQARREGRFPDLIDTLREVHVPAAWPDAGTFLRESADWFGLDRTIGQSHWALLRRREDRFLEVGWSWRGVLLKLWGYVRASYCFGIEVVMNRPRPYANRSSAWRSRSLLD